MTRVCGALACLLAWGCSSPASTRPTGVNQQNHQWFAIAASATHELGRETADGPITCDSCHPATATSFKDFTCTQCHAHEQSVTSRLHTSVRDYGWSSAACYSCHPAGEKVPFDHAGITGGCALCHEAGAVFAALPQPGFTHPTVGDADCGGCHKTTEWKGGALAPNNSADPTQNVTLVAQVPTWSGTSITALTSDDLSLPMTMNHSAKSVPAAANTACSNCHAQANQGLYFPGVFHASLSALSVAQPTSCTECHAASMPAGFVGPIATTPARTPPSAEMRHEAVAWSNGAPTATALVTQDCSSCHLAPTASQAASWESNTSGTTPAKYHGSLQASSQPASCLDCHANSRPTTVTLASGIHFDHTLPEALGDCAACHSAGGATQWTSWQKGQFHLAGSSDPSSCASCHEQERPTNTTGWKNTNYQASPFDYGTNDAGIRHGNEQDCADCHSGPGTGQWGGTQNWATGAFAHGGSSTSAATCLNCHVSQRPSTAVPYANGADGGFDHALNGSGDCFGCHQATVTAARYVDYVNPSTGRLPGGDWKGGQDYPGSYLSASPGHFVTVNAITLSRVAGRITGLTSASMQLNNAMLHVATALPPEMNAGPTSNPDRSKCWHCHLNTNGTVTAYSGGLFHASMEQFTANPGDAVTPLPQPTKCNECHNQMRPWNPQTDGGVIVERAGSHLIPMDHRATFTSPVSIGGLTVSSVAPLDCSVCHQKPGDKWDDGVFHAAIGSAVPSDCASCHYPLVTDPVADVTAPKFTMKHRSAQVSLQACETCHTTALSKATMLPTAAQWAVGTFHPSLPTQPAACNDCHAASAPTMTTASTVTYSMPLGATPTNGTQYMSHSVSLVAGKDCSLCHATDAKKTGSAWSRSIEVHKFVQATTTCNGCHGTSNGRGTVAGTNNNLPLGLTNSTTVTTSSQAPANTLDQISHADINVTQYACSLCHTQVGTSTTVGVQGKEWALATFHKNFTASAPLVMNKTTGRCSNCHLNLKPGASFSPDHTALTSVANSQDCNDCHSWPGTNAAAPNWLGAKGGHAASGSTAASSLDCNSCHGLAGSSKVHLTVDAATHFGGAIYGNTCISCHIDFSGFKGTTANLLYKHSGFPTNADSKCGTCHAFSNKVYTTLTTTPRLTFPLSGNAHAFSQTTSVSGTKDNDTFTSDHQSSNMTACSACHKYASTTSTNNVWAFSHRGTQSSASRTAGKGANGCSMCHEHQ